jgi:hypothetical protein
MRLLRFLMPIVLLETSETDPFTLMRKSMDHESDSYMNCVY